MRGSNFPAAGRACHDDPMQRRTIALIVAAAMAVTACAGDDSDDVQLGTTEPTTASSTSEPSDLGTDADGPPANSTTSTATLEPAAFAAAAGTEQVTVTGANVGDELYLVDRDGNEIASGVADEFGALLFRGIEGGSVVRVSDSVTTSPDIQVLSRDEHPAPTFYAEQRLPTEGLGYITTRDGTTLSASVWLPGPVEDGPYPTVVEYSGYTPSDPESQGSADIFVGLGYAYVGVNIRGTGCSGGSFRYFEYAQSLDGYDLIETVAAQPWVQSHRVGMVGVSYPGISQLFVGQTQPPSLAAITPFSVLADSSISTLYPGGILNTGFAVSWTAERVDEARREGQQWAADRIAAGDEECRDNQELRLQNPDLLAEITATPFWTDEVAAGIAPRLFVDKITVPTFIAGAWQDEQTGGHFPTMLDRFTGTDHLYVTLMNGLHTESIGPAVFPRFVEFLDLYVAERVPSLAVARSVAPLLSLGLFGTADVSLPADDRFEGMSYAQALAEFEAEPAIRVLFEEGAADGFGPRTPLPRFEAGFEAWPIPEATATIWTLGDIGRMGSEPANEPDGDVVSSSYLALPDATPPTWYEGSSSGIWSVDVEYDWIQGGPGTFAAWATDPLQNEIVVVGSGSVDLYIKVDYLDGSPADDTDLEVTISEIRPDGQELYVQSGWLRASHRALDAEQSTELRPVQTHLESDASPMPDAFELVRVELFPFAHVFRAGSRIRLLVDAPGGNRPVWEFQTIAGGEQVTIAHDETYPSRLVLPTVAGIDAPDAYPDCDALRGQPCRSYIDG
jgi:predicted acyl esterase